MKDLHPDTTSDTSRDPDPWVQEGLRALREQVPPDESRRATLAKLGIGVGASAPVVAPPAPETSRGLLRWLLWGAVLGLVVLALQRWLL